MLENKNPIIVIRDLYFSRGERPIFTGLNIKVLPGKVTAIMGPSGAGKTTLLNLVTAQLRPDSGDIFLDGELLTNLSRNAVYRVRRKLGVLFQGGALFTDLNVFENVAFNLREHTQLSEDMIRDLVLMMLESVGLRGVSHLSIDQLSGGMARRVALARSIVLGPKIMLYDEPFTGQDPITRGVLSTLIKQINSALNLTSVIISHDVHETARVADYIYLLAKGRVVAKGESNAFLEDPSPLVRQFVDGSPEGPMSFHCPALDFRRELKL